MLRLQTLLLQGPTLVKSYRAELSRCLSTLINLKRDYPELYEHLTPASKFQLEKNPGVYKTTKLEWMCEKGEDHVWTQIVSRRINSYEKLHYFNCPFCCGARFSKTNSLASRNPKLLQYWDYEKNSPLTPETISYQSNRKVHWQCPKSKDHQFMKAPFQMMFIKEGYCPYCDNQIISDTSRLTTQYPEIAKEWDYSKNKEDIHNVMFTSFTNYWWICKKDPSHQFKCTPYYRCVMKQECPYCSNSKVSKTYNLQVIYPEVAKEWHPTKNGTLLPSEVMPSGRQKVWWQCKSNPKHEWMASIYNRISGTGCPICAGDHRLKRLSETDLLLSTQYPEVYAEMDPSQFKSVEDMKALSSRSAKNVHWTCSKHHYSYTQRVSSRVSMYKKHQSLCPDCLKEFVQLDQQEKAGTKTKEKKTIKQQYSSTVTHECKI